MNNLQSAEKAYEELAAVKAQNEQFAKDLKAAQDKLNEMQEMNKQGTLQTQIESLTQQVKERDKMIRDYQDLNQKLFLQIGKPVDEKPQIDEEEKAIQDERNRILDKIKKQREQE